MEALARMKSSKGGNLFMVKAALMCCLAYWLANVIQKLTLLNTSFSPICLCALTGILLGKPQEGLVMGGYLQAIYLGTISIGGVAVSYIHLTLPTSGLE